MPVDLMPGADPDPGYLLEVLEAFAGCVEVARRQTSSRESLAEPQDAAEALRHLARGAAGLPGLTGQLGAWLESEHEAGRIQSPVAPVTAALDSATIFAGQLAGVLRLAAREAGRLCAARGAADGP
jgi:hypothetical protein